MADAAITARDLKAIHYVENAHGQLEEFHLRLSSRLREGLGPRPADPVLDGRADLQAQKIRITYAGYAEDPRLKAALRELADAHQRRLEALRARLAGHAADTEDTELDERIRELARQIRNWRNHR